MKYLITILTILIFAGCNPVKKVLKNKAQFEAIGNAWAQEHPCVNDTIEHYLPGDTVKTIAEKTDTVYNDLPDVFITNGDTVFVQKIITKTKTINNLVHDTVVKIIIDTRAVKAAKDESIAANTIAVENKGKADKRLWMLIASCVLNLLLLVLLIRKK
jgi:hypothetical protein